MSKATPHKPSGLIYGLHDVPPLGVNVLSGLQHVGVILIYLVYPVIVAQAAGASAEVASAMVSLSIIALALGTALQVFRLGPVGSGFLCQPTTSVLYLVPSLIVLHNGGNLPIVFGMTLMAGLLEVALAPVLTRLRPLLTTEIAGLVVLLSGVSAGVVGLRIAFGNGQVASAPPHLADALLALGTLGFMVALNIWGTVGMRLFGVLIGMAAGCVAAWATGRLGTLELHRVADAPVLALPALGHLAWSFDATFILPFVVAALAATLKVIGNVTISQKANDTAWVRPDMRTISGGVLADGLGAAASGALGAVGTNSATSAVGLATATGVTSRRVGVSITAILLLFAFVPKLGLLFNLIPRPVVGAALIFSATFIITNGLVIMTSRLLDARKTIVIGLAIVCGLGVEAFPGLLQALSPTLRSSLGNSLVLGTLVGLGLNLVFRLGVRRTVSITVPPDAVDARQLEDFLNQHGAAWGARRDVVERAKFNLVQSIETLVSCRVAQGPMVIESSFDEFSLDLRVSYDGDQLELPQVRPSIDELLESEDAERKLAGFLLRQFADRVSSRRTGKRATVAFHFDH